MIVKACELKPGNLFNSRLNVESSEPVVVQTAKIWLQSTGKIRVQRRAAFILSGATDFSPDEAIELIGGFSRFSCKCNKPRIEGEIWQFFQSPTLPREIHERNSAFANEKNYAERRARRAELLRLIEIDRLLSIAWSPKTTLEDALSMDFSGSDFYIERFGQDLKS